VFGSDRTSSFSFTMTANLLQQCSYTPGQIHKNPSSKASFPDQYKCLGKTVLCTKKCIRMPWLRNNILGMHNLYFALLAMIFYQGKYWTMHSTKNNFRKSHKLCFKSLVITTVRKILKNLLTLMCEFTKSEKSQESEYTPTIFRTHAFAAPHTAKSNHKSVCA